MDSIIATALREAERVLCEYRADAVCAKAIDSILDRLERCFQEGGKILLAGNGGSMADALHFAEEWTGRFRRDRRPFPALALGEAAHLTCVGNDFGFEHVFSRLVQAFGKPEDVLILLSTSGNSANLLRAAEAARACGVDVVGLLGRGGGPLKELCDLVLVVPGDGSDRIQELHMLTLHAMIESLEKRLRVYA